MKNIPRHGIILCLLPPLFWGGMFPIANSLIPTVNMFVTTLVRYGIVAVIFALLLFWKEGIASFQFEKRGFQLFLLGSAGFAGFGLLAFTALSYTSASNVSLIMAMMPAISAVLAAVSARRFPPAHTIIAIAIAFFGVSLVLTNGDYSNIFSSQDVFGELLALLGAICWVVYTRGAANTPHWSTLRYTTVTTILGVPAIAFATAVATWVGYVEAPTLFDILSGWPQLGYLIVFAGVLAVLFWNAGNKILGSLNGTLFMNLVPITTFTITALMSRDLPSTTVFVGIVLVIGGLLLNNLLSRVQNRRDVKEKVMASQH